MQLEDPRAGRFGHVLIEARLPRGEEEGEDVDSTVRHRLARELAGVRGVTL